MAAPRWDEIPASGEAALLIFRPDRYHQSGRQTPGLHRTWVPHWLSFYWQLTGAEFFAERSLPC
jgi:hypothetical protein